MQDVPKPSRASGRHLNRHRDPASCQACAPCRAVAMDVPHYTRMMHKTNRKALAAFVSAFAGLLATPLPAQEVRAVAGTYCLTGVMEVGSCIKLTFDGKFQYFLAYGAYDEDAEGTWRIEGGQVVLDSPAYDRRPTFTFKRKQRA